MFKQELGLLIGSHQKDVSQLFKRYGYNVSKPNVQNVIDACIVCKDDFRNDLADIFSQSSNFNGDDLSAWLNNGIAVLTGVKAIKDKVSEKPQQPTTEDVEQPRILGFNQTLFIVICIVVLILLGLLVSKMAK